MGPTQYSTSGGTLLAVVAMVVIVLLCRWVFSTRDRDRRIAQRLERARSRGDYGLLVPVVTGRTAAEALRVRAVLAEAGIRGTVGEGERPGEVQVLVFRDDADRARSLVAS